MKTTYIANAFSIQMLNGFPQDIRITEVDHLPQVNGNTIKSAIGHQDTAAVLNLPCNRINILLDKGDTLYVAQLMGGRLPEGSTTLPQGHWFKYFKVDIL